MSTFIRSTSLLVILTITLPVFGESRGFNMELVSLAEILNATNGEAIGFGSADVAFRNIAIDSRAVQPGDLFWAIRGKRYDGHRFIDDAIQNGAVAAVVEHDQHQLVTFTGPKIIVSDTLEALSHFAGWYRNCREALIVGVTGSVGKTTTREMIHAALSAGYHGTQSPRNFNNHVGLPLSLLEINNNHEFAVLELAASAIGEIRSLAEIAAPEVGVVTAISATHLEGFGNEENILRAKGELIESLPETGFAVLSTDDSRLQSLSEKVRCRVVFAGLGDDNDFQATDIHCDNNSLRFCVSGTHFELQTTGLHQVQNAVIAIAVASEIGMPAALIAKGLQSFRPVPGRCRVEQFGGWTIIDDTYNAGPASMRAACQVLANYDTPGKRILITGDMLELGAQTTKFHHELGRDVAELKIDHLIAFGLQASAVIDGARDAGMPTHRLAQSTENLDTLFAVLDCWLEPDDVVLVKGSRGMQMERVVEWLRQQAIQNLKEITTRFPKRAVA